MIMKRNYVINYFCGLLALILIIIGAGVFFINIKAPANAAALEDMDISSAEPLEYYSAEFLIVDIYAYYGETEEEATALFCYALARDKDGSSKAVSLSIRVTDIAFAQVKDYALNEEAEIGDCIISGYARAQRITSLSYEIYGWYEESAQTYAEILGGLQSIPMNFEIYCDRTQDFIALRKADQRTPLITALVCTVIGAAFAFAAFLVPGLKPHGYAVPADISLKEYRGGNEGDGNE